MPQVKSYRRYGPAIDGCLGVITSGAGVAYVGEGEVATSTLSTVTIIKQRTGDIVRVLGDQFESEPITALAVHAPAKPRPTLIAGGKHDGAIYLWEYNGEERVCFRGHRAQVSALCFLGDGLRLASGSNDTDFIIWDVVAEAGVVRLHGHTGPITSICELTRHDLVLSASRDHHIRVWDPAAQHCVQTVVGHRNEVGAMAITHDESRLITGSTDAEIRVWAIVDVASAPPEQMEAAQVAAGVPVIFVPLGSITRQSRERVIGLHIGGGGSLLACQAVDKAVEFFRFRTEAEITKRLKRRSKRVKAKAVDDVEGAGPADDHPEVRKLDDELFSCGVLRCASKVRALAFDPYATRGHSPRGAVAIALGNNVLESYTIDATGKTLEYKKQDDHSFPGHRTPLRAVAMCENDALLLTTSNKGGKVWDIRTRKCIRTLGAGYGICCMFVPGSRHAVVGTRTGDLQLFELASGRMIEEIEGAHDGAIWSVDMQPDKHGFATGGADRSVNIWEFELVPDEANDGLSKRLSCAHLKTLKMTDDVLCVKYSPDQRFLAIALLDSTVKVFFSDTLKFFLSLYGHKLPVLSMDISQDSTLIATGSGDKNLKLWGLDFGDCHKSFLAHQDVVTGVKFLGSSHYVATVSKDKTVKLWDGDRFEYILTLSGHQAEVSGLAASRNGGLLATVSHDRSVRLWERSDELLNLDEEREIEREEADDREAADAEATLARAHVQRDGEEADRATKQNVESLKSADRLIEAIEFVEIEQAKEPGEPANPILVAYGNLSPEAYLLRVLEKIPSVELEEALLVLPFAYILKLLPFLDTWIEDGKAVERCSRCLLFLLKVHHNQIVANDNLVPVVQSLQAHVHPKVTALKDTIGFNLAALRFLDAEVKSAGIRTFEDAEAVAGGAGVATKRLKIVM
eukprot:m.69241 g.69241  ORF g.69241 m.69241 type:complete len:912 (+) comp8569_c0_seq2:139-2874(+)